MNNQNRINQGFQVQQGYPRRRLSPFLLEGLNSGRIKGLEWLDRNKKLFKISWMDQRSPAWGDERNQICKEWAIHNNRYRAGDPEDWSKWKQTFRGALNKSPDVHAVPEMFDLQNTSMPYRVYQFSDAINLENPDSSICVEISKSRNDLKTGKKHPLNIPNTVADELKKIMSMSNTNTPPPDPVKEMLSFSQINNFSNLSRPDDQFGQINYGQNDFVPVFYQTPQNISIFHNLHPTPASKDENIHNVHPKPENGHNNEIQNIHPDHQFRFESDEFNSYFPKNQTDSPMEWTSIPSFNTPDFYGDKPAVKIEAFYFNISVLKRTIYKNQGVFVFFGGFEPNLDNSHLYGIKEFQKVELPDITKSEDNLLKKDGESVKEVQKLLNKMCRGLRLYCKDNKMFAYRHCNPRIFLWDETLGRNIPLDRKNKKECELFDMEKFEARLQDYKSDSDGKKCFPSPSVMLGLGQEYKPVKPIDKTLLVHLEVTYLEAEERLQKEISNDQELQFSDLNSADQVAELCKELNLNDTA